MPFIYSYCRETEREYMISVAKGCKRQIFRPVKSGAKSENVGINKKTSQRT